MNDEPQKNISFGEFELDTVHRRLLREGKPLALNAKTFDLLAFLVENNGQVLSKGEILDAVWAGQFVEEANLSVQISALRKALGEKKEAPRFLVTIPGKGYKFVADVNNEDEEIIIEKHKIERLVVNEEIEKFQNTDAKQLTAGKLQNRRAVLALAGLALLILAGFLGYKYFSVAPRNQINSLAVLPFVNQNNDPNTEYLRYGLAESVIYSLSGVCEFVVMSRN